MKTPVILLIVHVVAFGLLFVGKLFPGNFTNAIVAVGLAVEFPGWYLGAQICKTAVPAIAFAFFFNAILYYTGGMVIDRGTRGRPA